MSELKASSLDQMAKDFLAVSDTYTGTQTDSDPFPMYEDLRAKCPVMEGDILAKFKVPSQADYARKGRPVMSIFRYDDVMTILRDTQNWKSYINGDGFGAAVDNLLLTAMDGDQHKRFRALLQPPFLLPVVRKFNETLIRPIIKNDFIDMLRPQGKMDMVHDFSLPFPVWVIYSLFGFPEDREAVMKFAGLALRILAGPQFDEEDTAKTMPIAMQAGIELHKHVLPVIAERRASGVERDDLIGFMLNAEIDGNKFTDDDIANFVRMLLLAAGETTSRTFANMMVQLLEHPDVMEEVRQDRSLIPQTITETMRREPTACYLARIADKDMEVSGVIIPKGTAVSLSIASANRDPERYERPDDLWIKRPMRPALSFGFGPHTCMGMHIARTEMEAALDMILDLPNLRLDPDYPKPVIRGMQLRGPDAIHVKWDT
ncbi:MAG: cytochrome P450 [Porticoccaceae bacterium]|nr:cytochrome P450 [Porticoccaceae bacterium]